MRIGLAIPATLSSIKPLSLNRIDKIVTKGHPVFARPRRLAPDKLVTAKREFDEMIKLGVIEPSDSEWSSALHMVPKKTAIGDHVAITAA